MNFFSTSDVISRCGLTFLSQNRSLYVTRVSSEPSIPFETIELLLLLVFVSHCPPSSFLLTGSTAIIQFLFKKLHGFNTYHLSPPNTCDTSFLSGFLLDPMSVHKNYRMFADFVRSSHPNNTRNRELIT